MPFAESNYPGTPNIRGTEASTETQKILQVENRENKEDPSRIRLHESGSEEGPKQDLYLNPNRLLSADKLRGYSRYTSRRSTRRSARLVCRLCPTFFSQAPHPLGEPLEDPARRVVVAAVLFSLFIFVGLTYEYLCVFSEVGTR